jgi:hypothetical protein
LWGSFAQASSDYRLHDCLGQRWTGELISFPVSFVSGTCRQLSVVTADGEPVAFQVSENSIQRHADGSIAGAQVHVKTDLAPFQTIVFRALDDREARNTIPAKLTTDLRVSEDKETVKLETGPVGVRMPLGEFTAPNAIPAPYQGFKLAPGRWTGQSTLYGSPPPQGLSARVLERGPLFAEVLLTYNYPGDRTYMLRCRVIAGEPVAIFHESMDIESGSKYHYNDYEFGRPMNGYPQGRFRYNDKFADSHRIRLTLDDFKPDLSKTHKYLWKNYDDHVSLFPIPKDPLQEAWITTLHPWQNWQGCDMHVSFEDTRHYLGFVALHAGEWLRPTENYPWVRQDDGIVYFDIPINDGKRCWGVHFGAPGSAAWSPEMDIPAHQAAGGFTNPPAIRRMTVKHGQISLDRVKEWVLDWKDPVPVPNPVSIIPAGKLQVVQERMNTEAVFQPFVRQVKNDWSHRLKNQVGRPKYTGDILLCTGLEEDARELYRFTTAALNWNIRETLFGAGLTGYRAGHDYGVLQVASTANNQGREADILLGSPHISPEDKAILRSQLAVYAYILTDPDFWPPSPEIGKGNFNMVMTHDGAVGILGTILAGHPLAKEWQNVGEEAVKKVLESDYIQPNGAIPNEGMHYAGVTIDSILPFMVMLKGAGGADYFQHPAFRRVMHWYASWAPPVDVRFGRSYMPPIGYSHPTGTSQSARWALAAAMTRDTAPDFSQFMMATWVKQGCPVLMQIGGNIAAGMIDPAVPAKMPDLASAKWDGWGAILRSHADDPHETFLALCAGSPSRFAAAISGSLHLYAKGAPISVIFGCRAYHFIALSSGLLHDRILFDQREEDRGKPAQITEWAQTTSADYIGVDYTFSQLQGRTTVTPDFPGKLELSVPWEPKGAPPAGRVDPNNHQSPMGVVENVPDQHWARRILFVKDPDPMGPNYFVLRDSFQATLPTQWNLWCMAEGLTIDGSHVHFTGKYGVDLEVFMLTPPDKLVTGAWGPKERPPERQKLLQQWRGVNQPYLALLYPRTPEESVPTVTALGPGIGARVELTGRTDYVLVDDGNQEHHLDKLHFKGQSGQVQERSDGLRLALLSGVLLGWDDYRIEQSPVAGGPVQVSFSPSGEVTGECNGDHRTVTIHVPDAYRAKHALTIDGQETSFSPVGINRYSFDIPSGSHKFKLQ